MFLNRGINVKQGLIYELVFVFLQIPLQTAF